LQIVHLARDTQEILHMMADFVPYHIGLGEIARSAQAVKLLEKSQIPGKLLNNGVRVSYIILKRILNNGVRVSYIILKRI